MQTIKLDKSKIKELIENGDNCDGNYILIVFKDGKFKTTWMQKDATYYPQIDSNFVVTIPALDPDGDGKASEYAWWLAENSSVVLEAKEQIENILDDKDWSIIEFLENQYPEEWLAEREDSIEWIADQWLLALNEKPNDLHDANFMYEFYDGQEFKTRERVFEFSWKEDQWIVLDESSILKSYSGKFRAIPIESTLIPSPNEFFDGEAKEFFDGETK